MNKKFNGPFKECLEQYIEYKKKLGCKFKGSQEYKLLEFDRYTIEKNIKNLTLDSIYKYIDEKKVSINTKAYTASVLRGFTKFLFINNIIDFVIPEKIYVSKRVHTPYIFTDEEIDIFFNTAKNFYPKCKFKNDIILLCFTLLYCTGIRIGECLSIKFEDIDFDNKVITLYDTKNNSDRNIVINDYLINKIKYIKSEYSEKYIFNDYIFVRPDITRYDNKSIYSVFKKIIYYAKIEKDGKTPRVHDFRFTFCCKSYNKLLKKEDSNSYIPVLSTYVGHKDFKSTEYYLKLVAEFYPEIREKTEKYTGNIIRGMSDIDE